MERDLQDTIISPEASAKYEITNNSFILDGDNPKDMIVAEVGDTQQSDLFYPQMEIKRWDEVSFSVRLIDDGVDTPVITTDSDKVIYDKEKCSIAFYDLAPQPGLEEGAYEFEITLKEKPVSNVINFSIRTKGLKFYYQPELTAEEISRGFTRPDHVVGSYAVYYDNCPLNISGRKVYKTGKMGHIYRPKITDSLGATEWGDLNIDPVAETLTVTIPQDFLDTATYPINHAAGLTFGYTSVGGSTGGNSVNFILAFPRYTPDFNGVVDSISTYLIVGAGGKGTAGLYLAPSDYPTDLVGGTSEIDTVNDSWNVLNLAQEPVSNGTYYRIGLQLGVASSQIKYDSGFGASYKDYYKGRTYTGGAMPDPFTAAASSETGIQWTAYTTFHEESDLQPVMIF